MRIASLRANASIASSLVWLIVGVSLPLLFFGAYLVLANTAQSRDLTVASAVGIARNVAAATDDFLDILRSAIPPLSARLVITKHGDVICDPALPEFQATMPRSLNVAVFDRRGDLVCSGLSAVGHEFRASKKDAWFEIPMRERRDVLTGPAIGRISKTWVSMYAHPIVLTPDNVAAVIVITIDLLDFQPVKRQADLSPGSVAGIMHSDGTIVSRSFNPEKWISKPNTMLLEKARTANGTASYVQRVGIDGVERLYAFARITDTPWIAFAGLDATALLAKERRDLAVLILFGALTIVTAGTAAFVFTRRISEPMRGMADAARAIAAGGGQARAPVEGPREMRTVATEFNRMVESRQATETELRDLANRTRELADRLTVVEQSERVRISRELHDRIGQSLAILRLNLDIASAHVSESSPAELRTRLEQSRALLETTIAHVRNVMADLRPPALDEYGLAAALRTYIISFAASADVRVGFDAPDDVPRLTSVKETALFRIAQEALTNAAKHARAQSVRVTLAATAGGVLLTIADDGIGFEPELLNTVRVTWGITTMHERAEAIGARLVVRSQPGHGTTIVVEVER